MLTVDNNSQLPKKREDALLLGAPQYFTGTPCKNGHVAPRNPGGTCVACIWQRSADAKKHRTKDGQIRMLVWSAKRRAEKAGVPFDLDADYLRRIWPADNCCPIFGTPFTDPRRVSGKGRWQSASVDRVVPARGYVEGNVALISVRANSIKHDVFDPAVFRRLADWLEKQVAGQDEKISDLFA